MKISNVIVERHGLKLDEYSKIKELLKRDPNLRARYFLRNVE